MLDRVKKIILKNWDKLSVIIADEYIALAYFFDKKDNKKPNKKTKGGKK